MKVLPEQKEYLKNTIQEALVANPLVTVRGMQEMVKNSTGRSISDKYVTRLMLESRKVAVSRLDQMKMNERITEVRERHYKFINDLTKIAYKCKGVGYRDRLATLKVVSQLDAALLRAELYAGVFEYRQDVVKVAEQIETSQTVTIQC